MSQIKNYKDIVQPGKIFVAFDVETTGLDNFYHNIVELSAVKYIDHQEVGVFSTLIDPERDIPEEASNISGITDNMVFGKPKFRDIADEFLEFIKGAVLIAHNAQFDLGFINSSLALMEKTALTNKYVDTLDMTRKTYSGLKSYALQKLAVYFEIKVTAAHRAEDDARVCMELFYICNRKNNPGSQISLF